MIAVAVFFFAAAPVIAAGGHAKLSCSECHLRTRSGEQSAKDLRVPNDLDFCLRCHDGGALPDVMHGALQQYVSGRLDPASGREAGALNVAGDAGADGYAEGNGHTIGSTARPPGFVGDWPDGTPLTCRSCHAVHANGNYRQLGIDPYISDRSYVELSRRLYPADRWIQGNDVTYAPRQGQNAINAFCTSCHAGMHGAATVDLRPYARRGTMYMNHPTSGVPLPDAIQKRLAAFAQPLRVNWREPDSAEVGCLTCHRAHGSKRPFGLVYWDWSSKGNGEDGAGTFASLCQSCHAVGE